MRVAIAGAGAVGRSIAGELLEKGQFFGGDLPGDRPLFHEEPVLAWVFFPQDVCEGLVGLFDLPPDGSVDRNGIHEHFSYLHTHSRGVET